MPILDVIYIAGPITGVPDYAVNFNRAAVRLRHDGHIVFNPSFMPEGLPHDAYMPICYAMMDVCNAIYLLRGWRQSKGACLEYDYAVGRGMKIMFEGSEQK